MKNIVVIPNPRKDLEFSVTKRVAEKLAYLEANVYVDSKYNIELNNAVKYDSFPTNAELIIVIGGDGSFIDASCRAVEYDIPIFGVNLGKLGYLSEVEPDNIEVLSRLFTDEYKIKEKMLLSVSHISEGKIKKCDRLAVNDIIISHDTFLGIAEFCLETSAEDKVNYRADGIIFSTPAGSTAYSLSAGGPIIAHDIESILASPICPHSFFNRSIIFNSDDTLKLKNLSSTDLNISVDGRYFEKIAPQDECLIEKSNKKIKVLTFSENNMFSTLFKKMRILEDIK